MDQKFLKVYILHIQNPNLMKLWGYYKKKPQLKANLRIHLEMEILGSLLFHKVDLLRI